MAGLPDYSQYIRSCGNVHCGVDIRLENLAAQSASAFFQENLWLAIGILVISMAGSAARLDWPQMFWIIMLVGWIITYFGYRLLSV